MIRHALVPHWPDWPVYVMAAVCWAVIGYVIWDFLR